MALAIDSHVHHERAQRWFDARDAWLAELVRRRSGRLATMDAPLAKTHSDVAVLLPA